MNILRVMRNIKHGFIGEILIMSIFKEIMVTFWFLISLIYCLANHNPTTKANIYIYIYIYYLDG